MAPALEEKLAPLGVSLAHAPPGEELGQLVQDGFFLFSSSKDGVVLHGYRVISNLLGSPSLLSTILQLALEANLSRLSESGQGPTKAENAEERLKALGLVLKSYAESSGTRAFPHDPAGSLAALQKLADAGLLADTSLLVHPGGKEKPAEPQDGKIVLKEENTSYELAKWKQGPTDSPARLLAYEKRPCSPEGRHVLFVDLTVKVLREEEFVKLLKEQEAKYGK
jgi:hypothetical protein